MKKLLVVVGMSVMMLISGSEAKAQSAPYTWGIGGTVGSINALDFKFFLSPKLALQVDLGYKWWWSSTLEVNPNLLYQGNIKTWGWGQLDWFVGGGLSVGYSFWGAYGLYSSSYYGTGYGRGKVGINADGGVELALSKVPVAFSFDFRPGYGMLFRKGYTWHFFDWGTNLSVRYCFGK
ncbi:MAG: hypothetical protein LBR36_05155 [Bacteroidales bacterium]|jgi:hypothetical protein|nr:hypothetical protein [Bacteroidales bacterium]